MATLQALRDRVRLELGDLVTSTDTSAICDGQTRRFELPDKPVDPATLSVSVLTGATTTALTSGDYSLDAHEGVLLLTQPPADGAQLYASGTSYRYFSDADLDLFLSTALTQHAHGRQDVFGAPVVLDNLPPIEEYPVALLALVEALWALATDAAFDISISTPEGVSIPRSERWRQLMQMITARQAQYQDVCQQLNIGLYRIEMFDLRRVSRTTNRLIPIYRPREIDDTRPPERVLPTIDSLGADLVVVPQPIRLDLVALSSTDFTLTVTGLGDLSTARRISAAVRSLPNVMGALAWFTVVVNNAATGSVTVTLGQQQTYLLMPSAYWDLQVIDHAGEIATVRQGRFTTVRQAAPYGGVPPL